MASPEAFPPVEALVPHRGPSLLIERVLGRSEDGLEVVGRIPLANAFVAGGMAPGFVGIELAAQAAAALDALDRQRGSPGAGPQLGYIVGIREARFDLAGIPAGQELWAHVRLVGGASTLATYELQVRHDGASCLSAVVSTFRPREAR